MQRPALEHPPEDLLRVRGGRDVPTAVLTFQFGVVRLAFHALGVEDREIVHRLGIAAIGRSGVEPARGIEVLLHPHAFLIETAEAELGRCQTLLGGAIKPV